MPAASGENPWMAHLRALEARPGGEPRALFGALVAQVAERVLLRFDWLEPGDHAAVVEAAIERLTGEPSTVTEARVAHAVYCAAIPVDLRRWAAKIGAAPADIAHELAYASRRAAALTGRERSGFVAVCALDAVATDLEVGKVVLRAAVALQMRWNTAHQNVSRAWRRICEGSELGSWCGSFRAGHRFVCGPPSFELWQASRAYMDACTGRDGQGGEAFDAWTRAHEAHNEWFSEWKKQSARATRRWKDLAVVLDASGSRPGPCTGRWCRVARLSASTAG